MHQFEIKLVFCILYNYVEIKDPRENCFHEKFKIINLRNLFASENLNTCTYIYNIYSTSLNLTVQ